MSNYTRKMSKLSCKAHCCVRHGCKYGYKDCPVVNKEVAQDNPCEDCPHLRWTLLDAIPENPYPVYRTTLGDFNMDLILAGNTYLFKYLGKEERIEADTFDGAKIQAGLLISSAFISLSSGLYPH